MELIARANLIDLFFLILCLRVIYIAISRGISCESFKIIGLFVSAFFAFQYYSFIGNKIGGKISFVDEGQLYFISFLSIFLAVRLVFGLLRAIITHLFHRKETSLEQKRLLFFMGAFRAFFLSSIIIFLLYLSPLSEKHFFYNLSSGIFKSIAPKFYLLTASLYKKFNTRIEINKEVQEYHETKKSLPGNS